MLVVGCLLFVVYWVFVVWCSLSDACCFMFVAPCVSCVVCCSLSFLVCHLSCLGSCCSLCDFPLLYICFSFFVVVGVGVGVVVVVVVCCCCWWWFVAC